MKKRICCLGLFLYAGCLWAAPEPALMFKADVSAWLKSCPEEVRASESYTNLTALMISNAALSLFVEEGRLMAAARIGTSLADARTVWLSHTNAIQLEAVTDDEFKWIPSRGDEVTLQLLDGELRVRFSGGTVYIAPPNLLSVAEALDGQVDEGRLMEASVRFAPLLEPLLAGFRKIVDSEEDGFGKAIMTAIMESLKTSLHSLQEISAASLSIAARDADARTMTVGLEYRSAEAAAGTMAFFDQAAEAWKNPAASEKQVNLLGLVDTPYFKEIALEDAVLKYTYAWVSSDDPAVLRALGQAIVGSLFTFGDDSTFPVKPEKTVPKPRLADIADFNTDQFEADFRAALFLDHVWSSHIVLKVDFLDIANGDLLSGEVSNVSLLATNGMDVARKDRPGGFAMDTRTGAAQVSLYREKDQLPPVTASFTVSLQVPTGVETHRLTREYPLMEQDGAGCCLVAMSNSVVSLRSKGLSLRDAKVYALNAKGEYLSQSGASWSESHYRGRFHGIPAAVDLVFSRGRASVEMDFKNIAVGKEDRLTMPKNPTNGVPTRYTMEPAESWASPDIRAISAGAVNLETGAGWKKNEVQLQFPKPAGVDTHKLTMKSYLAGVDEFVSTGEGSGTASSGDHFYWTMKHTNTLNAASAVFGEIKGSFWSDVGTYSAEISTNSVPLITGGALPSVKVEHNVVWIEGEKEGKILEILAFDHTDRRLKKDNRTSWSGSRRGYYFWGLPTRVSVTYAASKENLTVPFEIELKEGGLEEIPAVREKAAGFEAMLAFARGIKEKTRGQYGELLSASYYIQNAKGEPAAFIPQEVAHSDPAGVAVFGYALKPCRGYYFRLIQTEQEAQKEKTASSFAWAGGAFEAPSINAQLLAVAAEEKKPAILLRWGSDVFVNYTDCSELKSVPSSTSDLLAAGWIKVE